MQKNDLPCAAARDLMPLVKDGLVSAESRALVEAHVLLRQNMKLFHMIRVIIADIMMILIFA